MQNLGLNVIQWDLVSVDGFNKNPKIITNSIVSNVKNGSIIVLHLQGGPNAPQTAETLPEIIKKLKEKDFTFVKVSEFIN